MRKLCCLAGVPVAVLVWMGPAAPAIAAPPETVGVAVDPTRVSTVLGDRFTIKTDVTNPGRAATGPLLAHLNIASITGSVYVDPEDWSASRSKELSLHPGETRTLSWELQAVNSGSFAVYVVILPFTTATVGNEPLVVSPQVRLQVASRSTLTAGGALPVVLVVPLLLGLAAAGARLRVRRRS